LIVVNQIDNGILVGRVCPVSQRGVIAIDSAHQPQYAVRKIKFDVLEQQNIAAHDPSHSAAALAASDQKLDVMQVDARKREHFYFGDRGLNRTVDSIHAQIGRRGIETQLELRRVRWAHDIEYIAGVRQQPN
jgi:hypothetical protein